MPPSSHSSCGKSSTASPHLPPPLLLELELELLLLLELELLELELELLLLELLLELLELLLVLQTGTVHTAHPWLLFVHTGQANVPSGHGLHGPQIC